MKLRYSPTSPYVRKVNVVAFEAGLEGSIERLSTNTQDPQSDLARHNPLGKVPALILDDGTVLYDSPVICEYLDSLHDGAKLFPPAGPARWTALRQQALGDGILDAAVLVMLETRRRPEGLRWPEGVSLQIGKIGRGLDALEQEVESLEAALTIGAVTAAVACGYLDFRFPDFAWRDTRPRLAAWYEAISERESLSRTIPRDPA